MPWKLLNRLTNRHAPKVPKGVRLYAVGDIHGRADLLADLLARMDADQRERAGMRTIEVYLGDYVDRGPHSREVLHNMVLRSITREVVCVKGNHETYLHRFPEDPSLLAEWGQMGGFATLQSYGLSLPKNMTPPEQRTLANEFRGVFPEAHRHFLQQLVPFFVCGDFYFVHAGVRPGIALRDQSEEDLLWIREEFLQSEADFGKIIVHGHTPVMEPEFRSNRINIDTGAYATGRLTCLIIDGENLSLL